MLEDGLVGEAPVLLGVTEDTEVLKGPYSLSRGVGIPRTPLSPTCR